MHPVLSRAHSNRFALRFACSPHAAGCGRRDGFVGSRAPSSPRTLEPPRTPEPSNSRTSESPSRAPCGMKARPRCSSSQATIPARSARNVSRETFVPVRFAARWLRMRLGFFCNIQLRGNGFHGDRSAEHSAFMPPHGVSFVRALACRSWIGGRGNRARRC